MAPQPAPRVFISYSHDTVEHQERVLSFADRLRADGIDAEIDQYNAAPPEGWPLWCEQQIEAADFVLMICTETYYRRVSGDEERGKGLGVVWEARIIRQLLYDAAAVRNKFVPVLFSDASPEQIPTPIKGWTRYVVDTSDGYEELYRRLTGQPRLLRPKLAQQPAPRVFISYSHDTVEHQERVLSFADRLRADGIDAEIDQYNAAPPEGWPLWCEQQIEAADFVLMICTETYYRRVSGDEERGKGLGVVWEARIIRQLLYDAGAVRNKFVPVLFSDASPEQIPTAIKGWTRYVVDTSDGYEELYRRLTGQPRLLRPTLGKIRALPARLRQWPEARLEVRAAEQIQKQAQEARRRAEAEAHQAAKEQKREAQLRREQDEAEAPAPSSTPRSSQGRGTVTTSQRRLPQALVEAIAARQVEDEDIIWEAPPKAARDRASLDRASPDMRSAARSTVLFAARSTVLKVLVFAVTATLIAIGLGVVGAKVLLFFNTTRKAKPKGGGEGSTVTFPADCSVFAPPALPAGGTIMVQVFLHPPKLGYAAQKAARSFDTNAVPRGFTSLSLELKKGARVGFQLQAPDICISDDGLAEISWQNRVAGVQFLVGVPADCHPGTRPATLRVFVEGVPAGRIHFLIEVKAATTCVGDPQPRGDVARNYHKAFISYASEDRTEVLKRVQTLSALGVAFFHDVLDLEPGQRWERALYLQIEGSDLFLLFWSSAARRSSWVGKEIVYALECQKQDPNGAPDIVPIIIEGPPPPPPPSELAELHFNDKLIYFMRC